MDYKFASSAWSWISRLKAQGSVRIFTGIFYKNSMPSNLPDWQPFWRRIDRYSDNIRLSQILQPLILLSCYHVCLFASLLTNWAYLLRLPAECPWLCYAVPLSYESWKLGMSVNHRASFLGIIIFYISQGSAMLHSHIFYQQLSSTGSKFPQLSTHLSDS